jgi:DivIVA domain-containing protein
VAGDQTATGEVRFRLSMRGYRPEHVDSALQAAEDAARSGEPEVRAAAARVLRETEFEVGLRGYDRLEVDAYVEYLIEEQLLADDAQRAADAAVQPAFQPTLRGYDPEDVDALLRQVGRALVSEDPARLVEARAAVQAADLRIRWFHAYDREQVDHCLTELERRLTSTIRGFPDS